METLKIYQNGKLTGIVDDINRYTKKEREALLRFLEMGGWTYLIKETSQGNDNQLSDVRQGDCIG